MKTIYVTLALFFILLTPSLKAAEADNFSAYKLDLPDQTEGLNNLVNTKLQEAVVRANKARGCNEGALQENMLMDFNHNLKSKMIKDILSGSELEIYKMPLNSSIYKGWGRLDGLILGKKSAQQKELALSPLMRVNNLVIGIDKLEHMFGLGIYYYTRYYDKGMNISKLLKLGTLSEKMLLGGNIFATGVHSYGDLSANFNGLRFWNHVTLKYDDILGKEHNLGPYVKCENDQWEVAEAIDMRNYIDVTMDESINCSKMATRRGARKVLAAIKKLELNGIETCLNSMSKLEAMIPKYSNKNIYKHILNFDGIKDVSYFRK